MNNIILTSTGLSNNKVKKKFIKLLGQKKGAVAIITTASEAKENSKYCQLALTQLREIGFEAIDFVDLESEPYKDFSKYDVIYVSGGNTFRLLKFAKRANFKQSIQSLLNKDGIYIGVSAGSIILGPSVEIASKILNDKDDHELLDYGGLDIVPFVVLPHYLPKHEKRIKVFEKQKKYKVERISDDEALLIINGEKTRI